MPDKYRPTDRDRNQHNGNKENEGSRRVLLAITVEIEDGSIEHIQMKEGDSAEAVATKFCSDHSLPKQFVAPLTEHIVTNIISISKEDKDIVFCSREKSGAYEKMGLQLPATDDCHMESDHENVPGMECRCTLHHVDHSIPLVESQKVNQPCGARILTSAKKLKVKTRTFSERLLAPTHTSQAKTSGAEKKEQRPKPRPLSERAKAVFMRLYAEFRSHKQKLENDQQRSLDSYQEKIMREKTPISKRSWRIMRLRGRAAKRYRNYGELLYSEGLAKKSNQLKVIAKKQEDDEAREMAMMTGKPEISKRAKQFQHEQGSVWDRLGKIDKSKQNILQELRNEKFWDHNMTASEVTLRSDYLEFQILDVILTKQTIPKTRLWEAQLMECTFKPQINHQWDGVGDSIDGPSRFEQLYLDAENRRLRQEEYLQWYPEGVTFKPAINRRINDESENEAEESVYDRLLHYATKLNEKKQLQEEYCHKLVDQHTGQDFFRPLTGRKPHTHRNPTNLPIGDFLYSMRESLESKKEALAEKDMKIQKEQASCQYVGATSQKIVGRLRQHGFRHLFEALDDDKDGSVELATADLTRVGKDVAADIEAIIRMGKGGERLSSSQFQSLMHEVEEKSHKGVQVHYVLKHKNHADDSNFTFKCKMDRGSRNLARRRRNFSSSLQWYKNLLVDREKLQQRFEALREERQKLEMAECTFNPALYGRGSRTKEHTGRDVRSTESASSRAIVEESDEMHGFYFRVAADGAFDTAPTRGLHLSLASASQGGKQEVIQASFPPEESDLPAPNGDKSGMFLE